MVTHFLAAIGFIVLGMSTVVVWAAWGDHVKPYPRHAYKGGGSPMVKLKWKAVR